MLKKANLTLIILFLSTTSFAATKKSDPAATSSNGKIPYAQLSPEEREILNNGEISDGPYIAGGVLGTLLGLGIGHAIQGRYMPTGLIFTAGEIAAYTLLATNVYDCVDPSYNNRCHNGAFTVGLVAFVGLRIWEIVDVWAAPPSINKRYRNLKEHTEMSNTSWGLFPVADNRSSSIRGMGLSLQYRF